jgi:hypothetical protein
MPRIRVHVDSVGGAGHVDTQRHALAFEDRAERAFVLCRGVTRERRHDHRHRARRRT